MSASPILTSALAPFLISQGSVDPALIQQKNVDAPTVNNPVEQIDESIETEPSLPAMPEHCLTTVEDVVNLIPEGRVRGIIARNAERNGQPDVYGNTPSHETQMLWVYRGLSTAMQPPSAVEIEGYSQEDIDECLNYYFELVGTREPETFRFNQDAAKGLQSKQAMPEGCLVDVNALINQVPAESRSLVSTAASVLQSQGLNAQLMSAYNFIAAQNIALPGNIDAAACGAYYEGLIGQAETSPLGQAVAPQQIDADIIADFAQDKPQCLTTKEQFPNGSGQHVDGSIDGLNNAYNVLLSMLRVVNDPDVHITTANTIEEQLSGEAEMVPARDIASQSLQDLDLATMEACQAALQQAAR